MKLTSQDERIHVLDQGVDVAKVVREICESGAQEEAFYVLDVADVVRKHTQWVDKMPRVKPYYAVKCNDSLTVLEVLASLGTGFDCASKAEIDKVMSLGVDPSRIIFANPAKPASHIRHAAALGVDLMTFDNDSELHKVKALNPYAKLVLRIRCDAAVARILLGRKFGCDAVTEAPRLLKLAQDLSLDVVGISFHVGTGCGDPPVFRRAIESARTLFDLGAELGFNMTLLDLGGGYPGDKGTSIDAIADVVNSALADFFPLNDVHIIAEPGRYYVASAYTLATCIHSKREVVDEETGKVHHVMYYINDGVYGSFNCVVSEHTHPVPNPLNAHSGKLTASSVWGPTCDGLDKVNEGVMLPAMQVGDWIVYENMGAYSLSLACTFNGFTVPKVHSVIAQNIWSFMKDMPLLNTSHFVLGNTPANLCVDLDIDGGSDTADSVPVIYMGEATDEFSGNFGTGDLKAAAEPFVYDYVKVPDVNRNRLKKGAKYSMSLTSEKNHLCVFFDKELLRF